MNISFDWTNNVVIRTVLLLFPKEFCWDYKKYLNINRRYKNHSKYFSNSIIYIEKDNCTKINKITDII